VFRRPLVDLALHLFLGLAVALLQPAGEFGALALDHVEIVIGELAPFLLGLALELLQFITASMFRFGTGLSMDPDPFRFRHRGDFD
jgi:hypothetical protein